MANPIFLGYHYNKESIMSKRYARNSLLTSLICVVCLGMTACDFSFLKNSEGTSTDFTEESILGEMVENEAAWEAAFKANESNYTLTGRIFYDDWIADAKICFENETKAKASLIGIQSTVTSGVGREYLEAGLVEKDGKYFEYWESAESAITDLTNVEWEETSLEYASTIDFSLYYNLIKTTYSFEDFSYNKESGAYITKNEEIKAWIFEGKLYKMKCKNVEYGNEIVIYDIEILFGNTRIELPPMNNTQEE